MQIDNVYTVLLAAIMPAFLLVLYIWLRDKYQREPFFEIALGFFYGVVSAGIAMCLELLLSWLSFVPDSPTTLLGAAWKAFVGAAIPEELAKLLMLWLLLRVGEEIRWFTSRILSPFWTNRLYDLLNEVFLLSLIAVE